MSINKSKIALGTVQLGMQYGINNSKGTPCDIETKRIFEMAFESGINILDTAPTYGDAEEKIANLANNHFEIVTKFSGVKDIDEVRTQFESSLHRLKVSSIYGYLAHNAENLINLPDIWNVLSEYKSKGKISKIGYSIYTVEHLQNLLDLGLIPDIVQVPYNILDRKFDKYFSQLRNIKSEIHVRSVFLQGLFYANVNNLPLKLNKLKGYLEKLHQFCEIFNTEIGSLALNFALINTNIDKVIIGVESMDQLKYNLAMIDSLKINEEFLKLINEVTVDAEDQKLLNPINW